MHPVELPRSNRTLAFAVPNSDHAAGLIPRETTPGPARRRRLFDEAVLVIERDYAERISLEWLAQTIFTSRRQLQRAFTEAGTTVRAHVYEVRMARAAELLEDGRHPVSEVARMVGYSQPAQFAKAFRRCYGVPPSRWRRD